MPAVKWITASCSSTGKKQHWGYPFATSVQPLQRKEPIFCINNSFASPNYSAETALHEVSVLLSTLQSLSLPIPAYVHSYTYTRMRSTAGKALVGTRGWGIPSRAGGGWVGRRGSQPASRESKARRGGSGSELIQSLKKPPCLEELPPKGALSRLRINIPFFFPAGPVTLLLVPNPAAFNGFTDITGCGIWSYVL